MNWHVIHEKCISRMFKWTHGAFSATRKNFPPYLLSFMGTHFRFINTDHMQFTTDKYSSEQVQFDSRDYIYDNISPVIFIYRYEILIREGLTKSVLLFECRVGNEHYFRY